MSERHWENGGWRGWIRGERRKSTGLRYLAVAGPRDGRGRGGSWGAGHGGQEFEVCGDGASMARDSLTPITGRQIFLYCVIIPLRSDRSQKNPAAPPLSPALRSRAPPSPFPTPCVRFPSPRTFAARTHATMSRSPEVQRREVSETALELLHAEIVSYFLHGHGATAFLPPVGACNVPPLTDVDHKEVMAAKRARLEALGQDVGGRLVERYVVDRDRLDHNLDMVKFICKDFWEHVFRKQIDVLRTNHRGLYVLTDNNFRWLRSVSRDGEHPGLMEDYVVFACGLICGALTRLGIKSRVSAELIPLAIGQKCSFNLQVIQN